jgi:curli biogenesis system outer membrane secretion channel CsgG
VPGILAEMLITATNMVGFSWQSSPVSTELEMVSRGGVTQCVDTVIANQGVQTRVWRGRSAASRDSRKKGAIRGVLDVW